MLFANLAQNVSVYSEMWSVFQLHNMLIFWILEYTQIA